MLQVVSWWAAVQALGLLALPLSLKVFRNLPDRGYAFSKILGLLCFSYVVWLSASARLLPNHRLTMIFFLLAFSGLFVLWLRRHPDAITEQLKDHRPAILAVEIVFLSAFVLWALVRSYSPAIVATEKPMDFAFLNSVLRASYFPPPDPWLSGFSLNYYYFGHFIVALLTKLTGVPSTVGFNLAVALFFALVAIGVFSLIYNLICAKGQGNRGKAIVFGLVGIMFLLVVSNLEGILEILYSRGIGLLEFWQWLNIKGLTHPYVSSQWYPTEHWWWWRATRVIDTFANEQSLDYTITEFPFFSFLLADMHTHVLALPSALMALALSINVLLSREPIGLNWAKRNPVELVIVMIGLGSLGAMHTWDLPSYTAIFITCLFLQSYLVRSSPHRWWSTPALMSVVIVAGTVFYYLPFYASFQRPITGILPWLGSGTRPVYWVILYGLFGFIVVTMTLVEAVSRATKSIGQLKALTIVILLLLAPLVVWTLIKMVPAALTPEPFAALSPIAARWRNLLPTILLQLLLFWIIITKARKANEDNDQGPAELYVFVLVLAATLLLYGTELFFVRDVLFGNRINTVFRLHYQAWILLSVAATYGLYYLSSLVRTTSFPQRFGRTVWWGITILLIAGSLLYPVTATINRSNFSAKPTLDGLAFLTYPEREAIKWLRENTPEKAVLLEAAGGTYTEGGRISEWTGIPTVLAWPQHETMWRGSDENFRDRPRDIETIFLSANMQEVKLLLMKYRITFIYIGNLEQQMYGEQARTRFSGLADIAFQNQAATILRVREQ